MRVVHVISTTSGVGGAEITLAQLVRYGQTQGWEQLVLNPFALVPDDPQVRSFYAPADYEGKRGTAVPALIGLRHWLSDRIRRFNPDVVHAHLFHASVLLASVRRPTPARLVLSHQHGDHFQAIGAPLRQAIDKLAGRRYDLVVGCSQSVEDYLIYRYGYSPERVCHIRNGWDGDPQPRGDQGHSIICVARFRDQKNHRLLIDAVQRVRDHVPDVVLRLVGDGETRNDIENYVSRAGLNGSVEFLGGAVDVWPLLAKSRVFALPSKYEPLGIAALEAMAAGLPVVAAAVGGLREIILDGETGFLVPAGSAIELAERLVQLLNDDELAARMGKRAQEHAQRYRAECTAEAYGKVYKRILASRDA